MLKKYCNILFSIAALALLTSCDMAVLNPKGWVAAQERDLLVIAVLLMLIVVIPAIFMTVFFAWRYRSSNLAAKYTPNWCHSNKIEVVCWGGPIVIIVILAVITWFSSHKLDPYKPLNLNTTNKAITVEVVALDWKWLFIYPEYNIASVNWLQFPANTPINFKITADAPMSSFLIPQLGGQVYAMAGMRTKLHLIAAETGDFKGFNASYSGFGFSGMKFIARASSEEDFKQWIIEVRQTNNKLSQERYNKLAQPSRKNKVLSFASVESNLFNNIIMRYMHPAKHKNHDKKQHSNMHKDTTHVIQNMNIQSSNTQSSNIQHKNNIQDNIQNSTQKITHF